MVAALKITKDMLKHRENIFGLEDIDAYIFDLDTAIEELMFAFKGDSKYKFKVKYINNIIQFAHNKELGLAEAFSSVMSSFNFPFREKSLFSKKCLINELNGGMERIENEENFDMSKLLTVLFEDQKEVDEIERNGNIYDIGEEFKRTD